MICLHCAVENSPSARFCVGCRAALGHVCVICGFQNSPESSFCGGCGVRLQDAELEGVGGERRQLTVLFCDMVGSTELSQLLDPEDLGAVIGAYQKLCGEAVVAHDGYIAQYLADGVVVYFGYPRSHEDEAQRAVRCGLNIIDAVHRLRESGRVPPVVSFDVRLGAHTGRVVVGPVGAGDRRERLALGDTPNIAARIQAEAEPGTLAVSGTTWKMVEGYFTGEFVGERDLKGVSDPVALWRVTGESGSRERVDVAATLTPFVGRQPELAQLEEAWTDSLSGGGRFVLLEGEAGVGKSRLAKVLRDHVEASGGRVVELRATPYNSNSPFHPLVDVLERTFALDRPMSPAERLERLEEGLSRCGLADPEVVVLLGSLLSVSTGGRYAPLPYSPARRYNRTIEILVKLVAAAASEGRTLLLIEDLQWADASTFEFLELLVSAPPAVPLMGIITARPELDLSWTNVPGVLRIELSRFGPADAQAIVRGVALGKAVPTDVVSQIVERSEGVALFLEEFTRSVLDSGLLSEGAETWEFSVEMLPATMDASLTARLDRLGASRATAQLAAAIGREFSFDVLCAASERDEPTLRQDMERLVGAGLAWPLDHDTGVYAFKHALVRDAAYDSLLHSTQQHYHRRIAAVLQQGFPEYVKARPHVVAGHLTWAGEHEEAVAFWEAAGHQAQDRSAVHEAADHFQRAIECLAHLPATPARQERELQFLITLAPLLMTVYGWAAAEVERVCERALALSQHLGCLDQSYPPMWGLWTVRWMRGELVAALDAAKAVLEAAKAFGVPLIEVTARHAMSYTRFSLGDFEQAIEEADAGLALFDFDVETALAHVFLMSSSVALRASKAHSLWMLGYLAEADGEWAAMLDLARRLDHRPSLAAGLAFALHGGGFRNSYVDQMASLAGTADELLVLSKEEDFFPWYAVASLYRGFAAVSLGEPDPEKLIFEGLEVWGEQTRARLTLVLLNVLSAEAFYRLGDDDEAFRRLEVAEAEMRARRETVLGPEIWRVRGRLFARQGDAAAAETAYQEAMDRARGQKAVTLELRAALDLYDLKAADEESQGLLARVVQRVPGGQRQSEAALALALLDRRPERQSL
jgi:class 3 adenylate cyclase/tetratricopeptide (TPR) repeat protein